MTEVENGELVEFPNLRPQGLKGDACQIWGLDAHVPISVILKTNQPVHAWRQLYFCTLPSGLRLMRTMDRLLVYPMQGFML
jgi:hypothetical protein